MRRILAFLPVVALGLSAACEGPPPEWHDEADHRWRELRVDGGDAGFTIMTRTGIDFRNTVSDSVLLGNRMLAQGAGVAFGDIDGDGLVDVFLARTEGPNALYRNRGGWKFEEIAGRAGVAAPDRYSSGAAFADIDGDGDLDLLLLSTTGPNAVFVNDGTGTFTERRDLGLDATGRGGTTPTMADIDGDGDLDLYVANYKPYSPVDSFPPQRRAPNQLVREVAPGRYEIVPDRQRDFKIVMRPDMGGLNITMRGEPDDFYLNEGGRFRRVPLTAGDRFTDAAGRPLAGEPESFALDARFVDLNGDGAPDLYVANDFEDTDQLWMNDGRGRFQLADWTAQRQISNSSMGMDVGDVNGDGRPDLFVTDMLSSDTRRLKTQMPTHTALPKRPGDLQTLLQQQRNTLFLNRGDGTFAEAAMAAGVSASGWSWGTVFLDVDLDGWQDILVAAGHAWDIMDSDTQERLQGRLNDVEWRRHRWEFPPLRLPNVAFRNRGDLTFEEVSTAWGVGGDSGISHAIATGDLDGDGDTDVVINRLDAPALVLRNDAGAPRVAVRLIGTVPNTQAIGAKVRLLGGAVPLQQREVAVGGLYLSHSDYAMSFAMGGADSATLEVEWRDGRRSVIHGVRPNRLYEIRATGAVSEAPRDVARTEVPIFEDATALLGGHTHVDSAYDDWGRQFLLPHAMSQFGPGIAWFDYDQDGDEDLLIGAGRGGRLAIFRNDAGRLRAQPPGPLATGDHTGLAGIVQAEGSRVVAGVSNWEGAAPSAIVMGAGPEGLRTATAIPGIASASGPIALADYDGDGDLDLFVGGRGVPGAYPRAATSTLHRWERGAFVRDAGQPALTDVGNVSGATFVDIDDDGDQDLVLARDWDALLLLINDGGRFTPAPASWGLGRWTGRWNGVAAGDLDGDGQMDLVATSWGRNTMTPADSARPLLLYHGPFGSAGEEEMLIARDDPRVGGPAPLNSYPRVRVVIPDLPGRISSFGAYADATVDQVLGPHRARTVRRDAVTLDHMVFLNRGGRFEARPLPAEAQLAPAHHASIADFDGDGIEDVVLSQNFFPTAVGIPRYDAGRGLLMLGDGAGGLRPVSGARSGLLIYGDQRGAAHADYDGDGRIDLVVSQNAAPTRLYRNTGARPGLRVRLIGAAANPMAVGARVRLVYGGRMGPAREITAGTGYWSQSGAVQVFGTAAIPTAVHVRWPDGGETRAPVAAGAREIVIRR